MSRNEILCIEVQIPEFGEFRVGRGDFLAAKWVDWEPADVKGLTSRS